MISTFRTTGHHACGDRSPGDDKKAPFFCGHGQAYLGRGYYFWEDNLGYAMEWGGTRYKDNGKEYLVIEAMLECETDDFFDLVGVMAHIKFIVKVRDELARKKPALGGWPIGRIIEYLKQANLDSAGPFYGLFSYGMLRCSDLIKRPRQILLFSSNQPSYLEGNPIYIICVTDKKYIVSGSQKLVHKSRKGP